MATTTMVRQRRWLILLIFQLWIRYCQGYFFAPNLQTTLPFKCMMASAQRNNSLVLFGGENATSLYSNNFNLLTQVENGFMWSSIPQNNTPPPVSMAKLVYTANDDSIYLFGGTTELTVGALGPLQVYLYQFSTGQWLPSTDNNNMNATAVPYNRKEFSVSLDSQSNRVYIYGGSVNGSFVLNDLWVFDLSTFAFTQLPSSDVARYGHSTSLLSNGLLVVTGGVYRDATVNGALAPMDPVYIFNTQTSGWSIQNTTGTIPSSRSAHDAVVGPNDQIILFGGDDGGGVRSRQYINSIAILDTQTWTWTVPTPSGIPPSRRSYAAAGLLDGGHLTVAFGTSLGTKYNDINVYSLQDSEWLQTFDETPQESSGLSAGIIAGIVIASVALLCIILFLLWRFQSYVRWVFSRIHNDLWRPRAGEPVWAETTRMCCKVFLLLVFVACLVFIIRQAITSPNVIQRIEVPVAQVDVPDIRFCFEGYPTYDPPTNPSNPGVVCQTNTGFSCSSYIQPLNMSIFQPIFTSNLGAVSCFLFRAPKYFQMTSTSGANNGSHLLFSPWGNNTITSGRIHISVYPKEMDPNVRVYGIQDDIEVIMPEIDIVNWMNNERNDMQVTNMFTTEPYAYSVISYGLVNHKYLQDVGWNYVGFSPITNSTPQVETNFRQETPNPNYPTFRADLGQIAVYPTKFVDASDREVKMYTLLNALGFVGGIFGLLLALQTWLFGYRPRSPWGVVQRWSIGDMKRSLLNGLSTNFRTGSETGIPFIHPVHRRFSILNAPLSAHESERERISRVEERMQILELLFKAYYVDDEVFRSLDSANRRETGIIPSSDSGPLFPPSLLEKGNGESSSRNSHDHAAGISLRSNHRRSSTNSSDDAPSSRQPLNP